jgi:hypothetical protein
MPWPIFFIIDGSFQIEQEESLLLLDLSVSHALDSSSLSHLRETYTMMVLLF